MHASHETRTRARTHASPSRHRSRPCTCRPCSPEGTCSAGRRGTACRRSRRTRRRPPSGARWPAPRAARRGGQPSWSDAHLAWLGLASGRATACEVAVGHSPSMYKGPGMSVRMCAWVLWLCHFYERVRVVPKVLGVSFTVSFGLPGGPCPCKTTCHLPPQCQGLIYLQNHCASPHFWFPTKFTVFTYRRALFCITLRTQVMSFLRADSAIRSDEL